MTSPADRGDDAPNRDAPNRDAPDRDAPNRDAPNRGAPDVDSVSRDIEPDDKDWTWALQRPCPDCGLDARTVAGPQVAPRLRQNAARWPAVCARADVRVRPETGVWSPLEYACHVRDVCRIMDSRVNLLLSQEDPVFASWDQDATAVSDRYNAQDPAVVSDELSAAAAAAAASFDAVREGDWQRAGRRSNGSVFTIETLGQYFLHDLAHHLHDVRG